MLKTAMITAAVLLASGLQTESADCSVFELFRSVPVAGKAEIPEKGKAVLVERITIKQGDTLGKLSQKYSGRSSYFPQILLFNDIKNPDRISAGKELLVPVSKADVLQPGAAPSTARSSAVTRTAATKTAARKKPARRRPAAATEVRADAQPAVVEIEQLKPAGEPKIVRSEIPVKSALSKKKVAGRENDRAEQSAYQAALGDYHQGSYRKALDSFNQFLEKYPASPLTPDAALYKAECLFKLSGE